MLDAKTQKYDLLPPDRQIRRLNKPSVTGFAILDLDGNPGRAKWGI